MLVQFTGFIAADLQEENIKKFEPKEGKTNGSVVAEISVAELTKKGEKPQFHTVQIWGQEGVHEYLTKGKLVEVKGNFGYNLVENEDNSRKYYAVKNASITLIPDGKGESN